MEELEGPLTLPAAWVSESQLSSRAAEMILPQSWEMRPWLLRLLWTWAPGRVLP